VTVDRDCMVSRFVLKRKMLHRVGEYVRTGDDMGFDKQKHWNRVAKIRKFFAAKVCEGISG